MSNCVTMDLKKAGNVLFLVGLTRDELGGSHLTLVENLTGGNVPQVDAARAKKIFAALHRAIRSGLVRACHDLSEGGLAVASAEMAFAGGCGATIDLSRIPSEHSIVDNHRRRVCLLFSESNSRFLCEVARHDSADFDRCFAGLPCAPVGEINDNGSLEIVDSANQMESDPAVLMRADLALLKQAWQKPLNW